MPVTKIETALERLTADTKESKNGKWDQFAKTDSMMHTVFVCDQRVLVALCLRMRCDAMNEPNVTFIVVLEQDGEIIVDGNFWNEYTSAEEAYARYLEVVKQVEAEIA